MQYVKRPPVLLLFSLGFYVKPFFFYQGFLSQTLTIHRTVREGRGSPFFHSTTFTGSWTLRHLVATLHVRWLSHIFNRNACVYQTVTRWDLQPYRITIWLTDWWCNVCLFTWWIDPRFSLERFDMGNRCIWTQAITLVLEANRLTKCASHPQTLWRNYQFSIYIF